MTSKAPNRIGGSAFGAKDAGIRSKVATASMASSSSAAAMAPAPIFSFFDFGKKKEDPPAVEEKKSGGFSNPFASLFSGSNLRDPKKSPDGKNFFDVQATTIQGKKVKLGQLCRGKKAILVVNVASA